MKSENYWKYLSFLLVAVHVIDLFILPFGTMCDSLAYISYGFDLAGIALFAPDQVPFPSFASNPYFPVGYPLILSFFISLFNKAFFLPVYIFQHSLIVFAQILFLQLANNRKCIATLAFILFLVTPEFHIYPQSIMSEGPAISLHAILIISLFTLLKGNSRFTYIAFALSSILLAMIRIMPFPVILGTLGILFLFRQINLKKLIALSMPVIFGIILIPVLNLVFVGKPVLTTSSGKHLHDRTIFSHKFPLIEGNKAQEEIVALIGEDKYRKPHWEVEHSLADKGVDMGFEVDRLLQEASKPYFKLYPIEVFAQTCTFTKKTLLSDNDHEFGNPAKYMTDLLAIEQQFYMKPFNDVWATYLKALKANYISYLYLIALLAVTIQALIGKNRQIDLFVISLYPIIGILLSSCISWDDPRRLREFLLSMLILTLLGMTSFCQNEKPKK